MKQGVDADVLIGIDDAMAHELVERARRREQGVNNV